LKKPDEPWTQSLVRAGVRAGVYETVGLKDFSDDDLFAEELGID